MCKAALPLYKVKEKKVGTEETILGDETGNGLWLRLECVGELALITQYKVGFGFLGFFLVMIPNLKMFVFVTEEDMRSV